MLYFETDGLMNGISFFCGAFDFEHKNMYVYTRKEIDPSTTHY